MNRWRLLIAALFFVSLCACATQPQVAKAPAASATAPPEVAEKTPSIQIPTLPCAEAPGTDSPAIRYSGENIYRKGSALPKEEGLACLEVLADWLKSVPQSRWQVTVASSEEHGFAPLALALKRQELLVRFFNRKGIDTRAWPWQSVKDADLQLQLALSKD